MTKVSGTLKAVRIGMHRPARLLALGVGVLSVAAGCGISDEPPPGGDPKELTRAAASTPLPVEPPVPVTMVSHEVASPVPAKVAEKTEFRVPENVTYGDAEAVFRKGRYAEAAELFDAYTRRRADNPWGHYMLGIAAWRAGDHGRAEMALRRTIEIEPRNGKALVNLGRVLLEQNRAAAALDPAEEAVIVSPESGDAWRVLGNVRSALGAVDDAVDAYRRALVLDDRDAWSMNNFGLLLIRQGRFEEALPPLARAAELKPGLAVFQNNLGVALERSGHLVDAGDAYRAALIADPEHGKAKLSLARVEQRVGNEEWSPVDLKSLAGVFIDEIAFWRERVVRTDSTEVISAAGAKRDSMNER